MTHAASRRPFLVERRLGLDHSKEATMIALPEPGVASSSEIAELRDEIAALRSDMASLISAVAPGLERSSEQPEHDTAEIHAVQFEIAQLVKSIGRAKSEIAAIKHPLSEDDRLDQASSELDAIVQAMEAATNDILAASERIEMEAMAVAAIAADDPELVAKFEGIVGDVVKILEACSFQDITGQRINKVVETVQFIEQRIHSMIEIWGVDAFSHLPVPEKAEEDSDKNLLNGPQLQNQGISQADIDAMFD